jgi:hypothetical protein
MVSVTAIERQRFGTYSAASAAALGIAPPRPIPARKRRTPRLPVLCTKAAASVATPNTTMLLSNAVRRPNRSPAIPAPAPPSIIPK